MSENNIFKQLQTSFSLKTIASIVVKFHMEHGLTPGFQNFKIGPGQESKMAAMTKNSKNNKIHSSPEQLGKIGYKFAWNISGTLVFKIINVKEIHSRIRSQ